MTLRVLIVGGGIAGLTAGTALAMAGADVEIAEIQSEVKVYGVGIIQPNNALRALDRIGVARACLEEGSAFRGWRLCDANGNLLHQSAPSTLGAPQFPANNGISRPALARILIGAARSAGARIRLGVTLDAIAQNDARGVAVRLTDGTLEHYDLIIAADGIASSMRSRLFGHTYTQAFTGEGVWRYNFAKPKDLDWGYVFYGARSKAGLVPMDSERMYLFLVTPEPGNPRMPRARQAELLRARLEEYGGPVGELRAQVTDPDGVVYRPMEPVLVPPPWHSGRIVLIGDAVHGTTPHLAQGASIAIEDAVVLAEMIGAEGVSGDVLARFAARRFPRCRRVVEASAKLGEWEMAEWRGAPLPDAAFGPLMDEIWIEMAKPL